MTAQEDEICFKFIGGEARGEVEKKSLKGDKLIQEFLDVSMNHKSWIVFDVSLS